MMPPSKKQAPILLRDAPASEDKKNKSLAAMVQCQAFGLSIPSSPLTQEYASPSLAALNYLMLTPYETVIWKPESVFLERDII